MKTIGYDLAANWRYEIQVQRPNGSSLDLLGNQFDCRYKPRSYFGETSLIFHIKHDIGRDGDQRAICRTDEFRGRLSHNRTSWSRTSTDRSMQAKSLKMFANDDIFHFILYLRSKAI